MNWSRPATSAESLAYEALRKDGRVIRKRDGDGYLYAFASEFEALAAEVHADLLALRAEMRGEDPDPIVESDLDRDERWREEDEARQDRLEDDRIDAHEAQSWRW